MTLERLQEWTRKSELDAVFLTGKDANFSFALPGFQDALLIVFARKRPVLFISALEECKDRRLDVLSNKDLKNRLPQLIKGKKEGMSKVGVNASFLPARTFLGLKKHARVQDVSQGLEELRAIKNKEEEVAIRKACAITCTTFGQAIARLKNGAFAKESDLARFLKVRMCEEGYALAYEPVVASGADASVPHYAGDKRLAKGFLIIDFGVRWKGYCADVTRTLHLGIPGRKDVEAYETVLAAQEKAIQFVSRNWKTALGKDVHAVAVERLGNLAPYFIHGLGHGLGLCIHEQPAINAKSEQRFREGMAFTVEPGIYLSRSHRRGGPHRFGIRIEDDLFIRGKVDVLTKELGKQLIFLG